MDRQQLLYALKFQNFLLLDNQVHLVSAIKMKPFVQDGEVHLSLKFHATQVQFMT